ncbi:hypothetical protein HYS31_05490 [Candidatus Woesearchaeota archaeon]|nr:hypothetical protein [Candidatus Woesearchaeota archaeon]
MASQQLIRKLADSEELVVPTLFKPMQFNIIKKMNAGNNLTENEKRYLRGNMRKKLTALEELESKQEPAENIRIILDSIGSYYITGLEALKHNGYGWYFEPKVIEVINTRVEGIMRIAVHTLKFIRVKSIEKSKYFVDKKTGLKYAANEQIFNDAKIAKNEYVKNVWLQMISRYGKMFAGNHEKFKEAIPRQKTIDYAKFGV